MDGDLTTSTLTKAQFVKRVNALCVKSIEGMPVRLSAYISKHESDPGKSEDAVSADAVRAVILPKLNEQIEDIRAMGAPEGDEEQIEEFLVSMQDAVDSLQAKKQLSLTNDLPAAFAQEDKLAGQYGLSSCAYGQN